jgi:hypothetical protein
MKKQHFVLPTMLLVSVLSACGGNSLTQQQAVDVAKKIKAYHEADTFAYKQDKVTMTSSVGMNGYVLDSEIRFIKDNYVYMYSKMSAQAESSSSVPDMVTIQYLYAKDGKYYSAQSLLGVVSGGEITKAEFDVAYTGTSSNPGLGVQALKSIDESAEGMYASLNAFITECDTSSSSSVSVTSSQSVATAFSVSDTKDEFSYSSTGDGNLTITDTTTQSNSSTQSSGVATLVFNDYYPESMTVVGSETAVSGSTTQTTDIAIDGRFHWDSCTPIYPDLTSSSSSSK